MTRDSRRRKRGAASALSKADARLADEAALDDEGEAPEGAKSGDVALDAFMAADVAEGRRVRNIQPHRILLTVAVWIALGWLLAPTIDETRFHFADATVSDLGTAPLPNRPLPKNTLVRLSGVLGNKAATVSGLRPGSLRRGPIQVRQMLGTPIFVEFDQPSHPSWTNFTNVTVEGRLVPFGPASELRAVSDYFQQKHAMQFGPQTHLLVVGERPGEMWRYPIAWALAVLIAFLSAFFLIRSMRERIVDED